MNLKEFTQYLNTSSEVRDKYINKAMSLLMTYFNKHKGKVVADERSDLFMDLVGQLYSYYDSWEGENEKEFCTYVYFKLMDWEKQLFTRYYGIKVSRGDVRKAKQDGRPLILVKVEYTEKGEA